MLLNRTEEHLFFTKEDAQAKVAELEANGYVVEHNLKEKEKFGQPYFLVKVKEVFDTTKDIMDQFKDQV